MRGVHPVQGTCFGVLGAGSICGSKLKAGRNLGPSGLPKVKTFDFMDVL